MDFLTEGVRLHRREFLRLALAAGAAAVAPRIAWASDEPVSLGKLDGFYRGTQLQGNLLSERAELQQVPDFLLGTSFPYRKRPYPEEVLFVDRVSMVRFLGGYNLAWTSADAQNIKEADLAYVGSDGKVAYRWELIAPRLDPYLQAGYRDPVIALDNVPWDLAAKPSDGQYGNISPPRDYGEWGAFIEAFCRKLVELYGASTVSTWSFRMGSEPNGGPDHTFSGTTDEYITLYDTTAAAVKRVLPTAPFGPGEFAGVIQPAGPPPPFVNYITLAQHCASAGVPFEFLANSSHSLPSWHNGQLIGTDPNERVQMNISSYENVLHALGSPQIPIYIFQFGILQSEFIEGGDHLPTSEPGGRGAAWVFHVLFGMKEQEPRLQGIWHWATVERVDPTAGQYLLYGNGWLYCLLDSCLGGDAYLLTPPVSSAGTLYKVLFVHQNDRRVLIVSAFHVNRDVTAPETVHIRVPSALIDPRSSWTAQMVALTDENAVYRRIKTDLAQHGFLKPEYARHSLLASVADMGLPGALAFVRKNYEAYERLMVESLTLQPFNGSLQPAVDALEVGLAVVPGSVTAITLDPGRS
jgi:hypothetical protein